MFLLLRLLSLSRTSFHFWEAGQTPLCQECFMLPLQGVNGGWGVDLSMCSSVNIWVCLGEAQWENVTLCSEITGALTVWRSPAWRRFHYSNKTSRARILGVFTEVGGIRTDIMDGTSITFISVIIFPTRTNNIFVNWKLMWLELNLTAAWGLVWCAESKWLLSCYNGSPLFSVQLGGLLIVWLEKGMFEFERNILTLTKPSFSSSLSDDWHVLSICSHLMREKCNPMNALKGEWALKWQRKKCVIAFIVSIERNGGKADTAMVLTKNHLVSHECEISSSYYESFECYMLFSVLSHCLKLDDVTGREIAASVSWSLYCSNSEYVNVLKMKNLGAIYSKTCCDVADGCKLHRVYTKFIMHKLFCDCVLWATCVGSWGFLWKFTAIIHTCFLCLF